MSDSTVRVWDPFIRIFHWSLVAAFAIAYFSGEEEGMLHVYSGYAVGILISLRLLWGFVGSRYARFRQFIYSPGEVIQYLKALRSGKPEHYIGHNPAGSWMIFALLLSLIITTISGLQVFGIEGSGIQADAQTVTPTSVSANINFIRVARADSDEAHEENEDEEFWEEIHEVFANLTLLLVFIHVAGVIVASRIHGENLARAMVTGNKQVH
jgi:cytochrome b